MAQLPVVTVKLLNQARLHTFFTGHGQQASTRDRCFKAGNGLTHQQRLLCQCLRMNWEAVSPPSKASGVLMSMEIRSCFSKR